MTHLAPGVHVTWAAFLPESDRDQEGSNRDGVRALGYESKKNVFSFFNVQNWTDQHDFKLKQWLWLQAVYLSYMCGVQCTSVKRHSFTLALQLVVFKANRILFISPLHLIFGWFWSEPEDNFKIFVQKPYPTCWVPADSDGYSSGSHPVKRRKRGWTADCVLDSRLK